MGGMNSAASERHPQISVAAPASSYVVLAPKSQRMLEGIGTVWIVLEDGADHRFAQEHLISRDAVRPLARSAPTPPKEGETQVSTSPC